MFGPKHYVPILKAKAGELNAIASAAGKGSSFTPILEVVRPDQTLAASAASAWSAWQSSAPVFVDTLTVEVPTIFGETAIELYAAQAATVGLQIIPVTGISRSAAQKAAAARAALAHRAGACVRLVAEDIEEPGDIDAMLQELLLELGLTPDKAHAVIDLDAIGGVSIPLLRRMVVDAVRTSTVLQRAATLTVAGSAFPETLSGIDPHVFTPVPRTEWLLWDALSRLGLPRMPTFGDYTAAHPKLVEFDPEQMTPAAKIVYTDSLSWLILKGRSVKGPAGYDQFHQLSALMIARPEHRGPAFSYGDQYLTDCATRAVGPGNLTTWVAVKTSHHLAHVIDQIASLPAP